MWHGGLAEAPSELQKITASCIIVESASISVLWKTYRYIKQKKITPIPSSTKMKLLFLKLFSLLCAISVLAKSRRSTPLERRAILPRQAVQSNGLQQNVGIPFVQFLLHCSKLRTGYLGSILLLHQWKAVDAVQWRNPSLPVRTIKS
jgi:hypothetical protein